MRYSLQVKPISYLKANAAEVLTHLAEQREPMVITQNGEAKAVLAGDLGEAEAIRMTEQRTRQFAKRQRTWFRRQHNPTWLKGASTEEQFAAALEVVLPLARHVLG